MPDFPKTGDVFTCAQCGMSLKITDDCGCDDPSCVVLQCCGADMVKETPPPAKNKGGKGKKP
jgi:hypothetical protein